ncbi:hypothetical protein [Kribbella deserti]|uniref:DMT family transporter n=1 Tax=Kribbella deserti TaxID=1926257 RepID=A0ABV6QD64_9ACTN
MVLGLGAALGAAALFGVAAILQAIGSRKVPTESELDPRDLVQFVGRLLRQPAFLAALLLNLIGFVLHFIALRHLPLYLAQAGIAGSLAVTALLATRVMHDRLSAVEWSAVVGMCAGLALLAASSGHAGVDTAGTGLKVGLAVALGVIAVIGLLVSRSQHAIATAVLGLLAGFGFAGVAISARLLPEGGLGAMLRGPTAYTLAASGALAFLLYSMALQRGTVTVATASMIAMQTITPAVVGVVLLSDEIRAGWAVGAIAGFAITAAGAIVLVRFERVRDETPAQPGEPGEPSDEASNGAQAPA